MRRKIILLCILIIGSFQLPTFLYSQKIIWQYSYGGSQNEDALRLIKSKSGNIFIVGVTNSDAGGDISQPSRGDYDIWLLKINQSGNLLWEKRFGGDSTDTGESIIEYNDDLYIAGSSMSGNNGDKSEPNWISTFGDPTYDGWIIKADSNGNKIWDHRWGGSWHDQLLEISFFNNGIWAFGETRSSTGGNMVQPSFGTADFWRLQIDTNGVLVQNNRWGGSNREVIFAATIDGADNQIFVGSSNSPVSGTIQEQNRGGITDAYFFATDSIGSIQFSNRFGTYTKDAFQDMIKSGNGYWLCGFSDGTINNDKAAPNKGKHDFWLVQVDSTGQKIQDRTYGGYGEDWLYQAMLLCDGNILLFGFSDSPAGSDKTQNSRGSYDFWAIKIDQNGNKIWDITLGGSDYDTMTGASQADDGSYIFCGGSYSDISGDKTTQTNGGSDIWLLNLGIEADFIDPDTICTGDSLQLTNNSSSWCESFLWEVSGPAVFTSVQENPSFVINQAGTYQVKLVAYEGCQTDTIIKFVEVVDPPVAYAGPDTISCLNEHILLGQAPEPGINYQWVPGSLVSNAGISNPLHIVSADTGLVLIASNRFCQRTDTVHIELLNAFAGNDTILCEGDTMQLGFQGQPGISYQWSPGTGLNDPFIPNPILSAVNTFNYILTASNGSCSTSDGVNITVIPAPLADFSWSPLDPEYEENVDFINLSSGASFYLWQIGQDTSSIQNPAYIFPNDGNYPVILTITDAFGCTDSVQKWIEVKTPVRVFVPSAFTPNGDGLNDEFDVSGTFTGAFRIVIFDRWGKVIYESEDPDFRWNGKINGMDLPEGNYIYRVEVEGIRPKTGIVSLIR